MNINKIIPVLLVFSLCNVSDAADDKVDINKLRQSRQQSTTSVSPEITISLEERKQAYESAKYVQNESVLGYHARKFAEDLARESKEHNFVMVKADCSGFCLVEKFSLSGPSNVTIPDPTGTNSTSIMRLLPDADFSGNYSYAIKIEKGRLCTGSFYFDGKTRNIIISVSSDNCKLNLNTF